MVLSLSHQQEMMFFVMEYQHLLQPIELAYVCKLLLPKIL